MPDRVDTVLTDKVRRIRHIKNADEVAQEDVQVSYHSLPDWVKTATPDEARDYINAQVFNGYTQAQVNSWIDANITGTNVTALRKQTIETLKVVAGAVIGTRDVLKFIAKLLIFVRDRILR